MRRLPRLLLAIFIAIGSTSVPMPAHALPETWVQVDYYRCNGGWFFRETTTCHSLYFTEGTYT